MKEEILYRVIIGECEDDYVFAQGLSSYEEAEKVKEEINTKLKLKLGVYTYIEKYNKNYPFFEIKC